MPDPTNHYNTDDRACEDYLCFETWVTWLHGRTFGFWWFRPLAQAAVFEPISGLAQQGNMNKKSQNVTGDTCLCRRETTLEFSRWWCRAETHPVWPCAGEGSRSCGHKNNFQRLFSFIPIHRGRWSPLGREGLITDLKKSRLQNLYTVRIFGHKNDIFIFMFASHAGDKLRDSI